MVFFIVSTYTLNKTMNISSDVFIVPKVTLVSILEPIFYVFSSKKFHSLIPGKLLKMISLCLKLHYITLQEEQPSFRNEILIRILQYKHICIKKMLHRKEIWHLYYTVSMW